MAIFKRTEKEVTKEVKTPAVVTTPITGFAGKVIVRPRITEKATMTAEQGVYVFEVTPAATKQTIMKAIEEVYKVKPVGVNIVNLPSKKVFTRGKHGSTKAIKKAYVHLKEGDKIEFV